MTQVTFYLIEQQAQDSDPRWDLACQLAAQCYQNRRRCLVLCDDQQQAEAFDELLWQQPDNRFVPHNLSGEGPANGTPVEISWQDQAVRGKPVLINLKNSLPPHGQHFQVIYDFVPAEEQAKQAARERYKQYRAAGFSLDTVAANSINETTNG